MPLEMGDVKLCKCVFASAPFINKQNLNYFNTMWKREEELDVYRRVGEDWESQK